MHVIVHHSKYYDWEPVPAGVTVTDADKAAHRVKPSGSTGGWLMRVTKEAVGGTHTVITIPELQIIQLIIGDAMRDRGWHTRTQAVAQYVARMVMPNHAHRNHISENEDGVAFEVEHDEPDLALFQKVLALHTKSDSNLNGELSEEDAASLEELYSHPSTSDHHVDALHAHFRVAKKGAQL